MVGTLLAAGSASAATFTVTNLADSGPGSLRQAVADANAAVGADTIVFQSGLTGTITLTSGVLTISDALTVNGPGASLITISGNNASGILNEWTKIILALTLALLGSFKLKQG